MELPLFGRAKSTQEFGSLNSLQPGQFVRAKSDCMSLDSLQPGRFLRASSARPASAKLVPSQLTRASSTTRFRFSTVSTPAPRNAGASNDKAISGPSPLSKSRSHGDRPPLRRMVFSRKPLQRTREPSLSNLLTKLLKLYRNGQISTKMFTRFKSQLLSVTNKNDSDELIRTIETLLSGMATKMTIKGVAQKVLHYYYHDYYLPSFALFCPLLLIFLLFAPPTPLTPAPHRHYHPR